MPVIIGIGTTGLSIYVLFDDPSDTAVDMAEGTGLKQGIYTADDASILAAGLQAGTWLARVLEGDEGAPSASDTSYGSTDFHWDGSRELTLDAQILSEVQNSKTIVPDPNRVWVLRRTGNTVGSTKTIAKKATEDIRLYVDFSRMLGTNEGLGSTSTMTVDATAAAATVDTLTFDKDGDIVSFAISGGLAGDYTLTIQIESDTGDPITADLSFKVL